MPTRKGSRKRRDRRAAQERLAALASEPAEESSAGPEQAEDPAENPAAPARSPEPVGAVEPPPERVRVEDAREANAAQGPSGAARRNKLFPLGVNYYPLDAETQRWDEWYTGDLEADFSAFSEARMSLVRLFVSWKALEPQVGQYDEDAIERLQAVIDAARARKMQVIICLFADDRLSEMLDVPWGKKRDPRTDSYLIQREAALAQKLVNRFRADTAVFAWDLANEAFCSGFSSTEDLDAWVVALRDAVREVDPDRPIIVSADPETLFRHAGVDARSAIDRCEFAISHATTAYRAFMAPGPITLGVSSYLDSFMLRSAARGLPVLLDDVGPHSLDHSPAEEAAYLRTALYSGLMNGAAGALVRRYRDLDTERREPYFRDPFEVLVGIADIEGVPKSTYAELVAFARTVARIDLSRYELAPERMAVLVPAERYEALPSMAGLYGPRACLTAYIAAKRAHVPVTVTSEGEPLDAFSVVVVPSAFALGDRTWDGLRSFVQEGGSLVMSYGGGDAHPAVREIFGVEFLGDAGGRDRLSCRVAQPDLLGALSSFDAVLGLPNFALLGHGGATIVATDEKGNPLLTSNQYGQGRAVFVSLPVERAIAQGDQWAASEAVATMLTTVLGAVADVAGCGSAVSCDSPDVEIALFNGEDDDILTLLNHSARKVTAGLAFDRSISTLSDVRGGADVQVGGSTFGVPLQANGAAALRLAYK